MATSTKVLFQLETLREKALESIDSRIAIKLGEIRDIDDRDRLDAQISKWRVEQEEKIRNLFHTLDSLDDETLAQFRLDPIPRKERHERDRVARELRRLEAERTQIVAKSNSLVADEDGNISLTKTQLSEFFGL